MVNVILNHPKYLLAYVINLIPFDFIKPCMKVCNALVMTVGKVSWFFVSFNKRYKIGVAMGLGIARFIATVYTKTIKAHNTNHFSG